MITTTTTAAMGRSPDSSLRGQALTASHLSLLLLLLLVHFGAAGGDIASDRQECQDSLVQLVTCLPYVQASAPTPTPDCCDGLTQVLAKSPKCLCILIKDRDDPSLALNINLGRALSLQSKCKVPGDTASLCPKLLNLDPNSPEAKVFKQFGNAKNGTSAAAAAGGTTTAAVAPGSSSVGNNGSKSNNSTNSNGGSSNYYYGRKTGMEVFNEVWVYCLALLIMLMAC